MTVAVDIGTLVNCSAPLGQFRAKIAGTNTSVRRIAVLYKQGTTPEEIARRLNHLSLAQVYAALAYYHANHEEIEKDLAAEEAEYQALATVYQSNQD